MRLTLNILLYLITKAKIQGKGKTGNGRLIVQFLQVLADGKPHEKSRERTILNAFCDQPVISNAYQVIDKLLVKFLKSGRPYPYGSLHFTEFERSLNDWKEYAVFLKKMRNACDSILDPYKKEELAYTLLELLRQDQQFPLVLYGKQFIPKEQLFGDAAHPRRICLPALLLGLLYQTHQLNDTEASAPCELMELPKMRVFHLVDCHDDYLLQPELFAELLNPDVPVSIETSVTENAVSLCTEEIQTSKKLFLGQDEGIYPLEMLFRDRTVTALPDTGNLFLYGTGGVGKTTLLLSQRQNTVPLLLPLYQYQPIRIPSYLQTNTCWILLQILLKYHYQYFYQTYEACAAGEGTETVLRQLTDLNALLQQNPNGFPMQYTLMLDGLNELPVDDQDALIDELARISKEWQNVRLIITGRTVPHHALFHAFQQIQICGIPNDALSNIPNAKMKELLKIPLFLQLYHANNTDTAVNRAELLNAYVNHLAEDSRFKAQQPFIRFLVLYVLPIVANIMAQSNQFEIDRANLSEAVDRAFEIFIADERVYQNLILPQNIRKKSLPIGSEKDDWIDFLLEQICLLTVSSANHRKLRFTHQYFRDYFAAKYIINLLDALETGYAYLPEERAALFVKYELGHIWYPAEMTDIYRLIGELAGDDRNQASEDFWYHRTLLDSVLDWSRQFDTFRATENVIRTMAAVRNNIICGVDFSRTTLPLYLPCNIKFSLNGEEPCDFRRCHVQLGGIFDGDICCMTTSPDQTKMLLVLEDQYVIVMNAYTKEILHEYDFLYDTMPWFAFEQASFSPNSRFICMAADNGVLLLETDTGEIRYQRFAKNQCDTVEFACFSKDERYFFARINNQDILIDLQTGKEIPMQHTPDFYGLDPTEKDTVKYAEKTPICEQDDTFLTELYSHLPHFKHCDFTGASFLTEYAKNYLLR